MIKKLFITLICIFSLSLTVSADSKFLFDQAMLFNEEETINLENRLNEISLRNNVNCVIVTTNNLDGKDIETYSDDFYDQYFTGDGVLLCLYLGIDENNVYISTCGNCINTLTYEEIDYIFDAMWDDLVSGEYYNACLIYPDEFDLYHNNGQAYSDDEIEPVTRVPQFGTKNILISVCVAALITVIVGVVLSKQLKDVKPEHYAHNYIDKNSFVLTGFSDFFITRRVSRTPIHRDNGSSHGGGSHSHISSSGVSHGGHGRSF